MFFWECPKPGCFGSVVEDDEEKARAGVVTHLAEPGHEQWRDA